MRGETRYQLTGSQMGRYGITLYFVLLWRRRHLDQRQRWRLQPALSLIPALSLSPHLICLGTRRLEFVNGGITNFLPAGHNRFYAAMGYIVASTRDIVVCHAPLWRRDFPSCACIEYSLFEADIELLRAPPCANSRRN